MINFECKLLLLHCCSDALIHKYSVIFNVKHIRAAAGELKASAKWLKNVPLDEVQYVRPSVRPQKVSPIRMKFGV